MAKINISPPKNLKSSIVCIIGRRAACRHSYIKKQYKNEKALYKSAEDADLE
jgi:hypothetical protein